MGTLWEIFSSFFKIGLFTFGGGLSMLPLLERELVERRGWAQEQELLDYYAVGQCTPGIIAVNTATFVGRKVGGIVGAVVATAGVVCPSVIIITVIALFLENIAGNPLVQHAFGGIRIAVAALIFNSILKLWKSGVKGAYGILAFVAALAAALVFHVSTPLVVAAAIACGILIGLLRGRGAEGGDGS